MANLVQYYASAWLGEGRKAALATVVEIWGSALQPEMTKALQLGLS